MNNHSFINTLKHEPISKRNAKAGNRQRKYIQKRLTWDGPTYVRKSDGIPWGDHVEPQSTEQPKVYSCKKQEFI